MSDIKKAVTAAVRKVAEPASPIRTLKEADRIAKLLGLVRGSGTYNGTPFWVKPGSSAIITRKQLAKYWGYDETDTE